MKATVLVDLGYGDSGKGATVDYFSRQALSAGENPVVVRYTSGAQCAHNVVTPEGMHHEFRHYGSGSLVGVPTFLSRDVIITTEILVMETGSLAAKCSLAHTTLPSIAAHIDSLVTMPWQRAMNMLKEAHRQKTGVHHGSCGFGIGETMDYALRFPDHAIRLGDFYELSAQDLTDKAVTSLRWYMSTYAELIEEVRANSDIKADYVLDWFNDFDSMTEFREVMNRVCEVEKANLSLISIRPMSDAEWHSQLSQFDHLIFEGGQGVMLDEWYGFNPHTTWATTTSANAKRICDELDITDTVTYGITRAYSTRHGAGPMPTEDATFAEYMKDREIHNRTGAFQGSFRFGFFDAVGTTYAIEANGGIDALIINNIDDVAALDVLECCIAYRDEDDSYVFRLDVPAKTLEASLALTNYVKKLVPQTFKCPLRWAEALEVPREELYAPIGTFIADLVGESLYMIGVGTTANDRIIIGCKNETKIDENVNIMATT